MAISGTITQDLKYPMVGDVLTTRVKDLTVGNRVRWRVSSAPPGSQVALWVDGELPENWIDAAPFNGCRFAGDVEGEYVLEAVEEDSTSYIPHYDGDGSTLKHPIEEWTEVTTETYTVYFGIVLEKVLGFAPHTITLRAWIHADTINSFGGALTYWGDRKKAPVLVEPSSDIALMAGAGTELLEQLARYGGFGYTGVANLIGASIFSQDPYQLAWKLAFGVNKHFAYITDTVHGAADSANLMGAVALPTDDASFIAWVNTFVTKYMTHIALGAATHPNGADITNVVVLGVAATYLEAFARFVQLITKYESHRLRITTGHSLMGDGFAASRVPEYPAEWSSSAFDSDTATYCAEVAAAYDNHLGVLGSGAGYHAAADSDNTVDYILCTGLADLKSYVNMLAKNISAHALNIDSTTNTDAASPYHTIKDYGGDMSAVPRASDWPSTIALLDKTVQIFLRHIDVATNVHLDLNPAAAYVSTYGANLLNKLFMDNVVSSTFGSPSGVFSGTQTLLSTGGFRKV